MEQDEFKRKPVSVPYNFIRLPKQVIPAEFYEGNYEDITKDVISSYCKHIKKKDNYSGYIDVSIMTKTPLFIGESAKADKNLILEFYGGKDTPRIPGSSIKGMVKQIFKIITASSFRPFSNVKGVGDFEDKNLYLRSFADKILSFRKYYKDRMVTEEANGKGQIKPATKASAGFIIQTKKGSWFIVPSTKFKKSYKGKPSDKASIIWDSEFKYVDIHVGKMSSKKSYMRILVPTNFDVKQRISIPQECLNSYRDDRARKKNATIHLLEAKDAIKGIKAVQLTGCKDIDYVVPCFYTAVNGEVKHFGHGRFYRIAYDFTIGHHIPKYLRKQNKGIDLTDSIFGYGNSWAGRVSFTDAIPSSVVRMCEANFPRPLMTPNPTSFQFYLVQDFRKPMNEAYHWGDKNSVLRGYKMYWHQSLNKSRKWMLSSSNKIIKGMKKIRPVDENTQFTSRIYFKHLSAVELGALLMALNLNEVAPKDKCIYYKLGMGKSIGLGSIELNTELTIIETEKRYNKLFNSHGWETGEIKPDISQFIKSFKDYVNHHILQENKNDYNNILKDLYRLMDWNIANGEKPVIRWDEAMTMMPVGNKNDRRFRDRIKLDLPKSFIEKWSK